MSAKQITPGRTFSVWHDRQEQWDPEDIDPPALRCTADSYIEAAEKCADDSDDSCGTFIVRDDAADVYRCVELVRSWAVKSDLPTSLAKLSAP